ncbi:MAG TPA: GNAT family N-acetyltransferase [Anaerolineales bacterium]|nr:GNAT family N-acetyltransferase [Anaerolineales bacterium]
MTTDASLLSSQSEPHLRHFDVTRDLEAVADLIEECFAETMTSDGHRFLRHMRSAARNPRFLRWALSVSDYVTFPLTGYVWEEGGRIVGNVSMIPYTHRGKRIYLIANVAVLPQYRRQGIARALTEQALDQARRRRQVSETWLQVRDDNQAALQLYQSVGYTEQARRTTWLNRSDFWPPQTAPRVKVVPQRASDWPQQKSWLKRLYPDQLTWNLHINYGLLRPGLLGWARRLFSGSQIKQWSALREGQLAGVLSWQPNIDTPDSLWLAAPPDGEELAIQSLVGALRQLLPARRRFSLDLPSGLGVRSLEGAGFTRDQTLIWMTLKV